MTFYDKDRVRDFLEEFNDKEQEMNESIGMDKTETRTCNIIQKCLVLSTSLIDILDKYWDENSAMKDDELEELVNNAIIDFNDQYEQQPRKDKRITI